MPQPPAEPSGRASADVRALSERLTQEFALGASRHDEIIAKFEEQQQFFKEHFFSNGKKRADSEVRFDSSHAELPSPDIRLTPDDAADRAGKSFGLCVTTTSRENNFLDRSPSTWNDVKSSDAQGTVKHEKLVNALGGHYKADPPMRSNKSTKSTSSRKTGNAADTTTPSPGPDVNEKVQPIDLNRRRNSRDSRVSTTSSIADQPNWRSCIRYVVTDEWFEIFVASTILSNALILCCEVQYKSFDVGYALGYSGYNAASHVVWPGAHDVFEILDWIFGITFTLEAILKIMCYGPQYFRQGWSYLDMICVVAFLADKIAAGVLQVDGKTLRLLRLCRLIRLIKLMRYLESLDVLYIMTTSISGMARIVGWAVVLLSLMLMMCALLLTQILHSSYFDEKNVTNLSDIELKRYQALYEHFGSFTRCMLSMFEITLANWPPVIRLLSEEVTEWFMLLGVVHKLTIGFAVVGVLNGVILQETFKVAATDDIVMVRQKKRAIALVTQKMRNLFEALDVSGDGKLDYSEFLIIARHPEVTTWLNSMNIETNDLQTLFLLCDADASGSIDLEELIARMPRISGAARGIDVMNLARKLNIDVFQSAVW